MATFLKSPLSPNSIHHRTFYVTATPKHPTARLSGATTFACPDEQEYYAHSPTTTIPDMPLETRSKPHRSDSTSTTKSQLRQANRTLLEKLEDIQKELSVHRSIMLDMQARLIDIERSSRGRVQSTSPPDCYKPLGRPRERRKSSLTRESFTWWEACQNYALNCDTPFNVNDFLHTPRPFSGLDFELEKTIPRHLNTPITPSIYDVPPLTPGSDGSEIVERVVEFDYVKIPMPPLLDSPPRNRSKASSIGSVDEEITALPKIVRPLTRVKTPPQQRQQHRRIRSFFSKLGGLHRYA